MYIENINNTNYIKVNDTATRIQLKISDNLSNPFDLKSAMQVVVVIGNRNGRILSKIPNLLDDTGVLEFGLDEGDLLEVGGNLSEVGDNLIEVHIIMPNGEKFVAPSSGHYKLRVTRSIDTLGEKVTTVTLDYFIEKVDEKIAELQDKIDYVEETREYFETHLDETVDLAVDNKMTPFVDEVSAQLAQKANKEEITELLGNIANGTPLFASTISEMTDADRLYVNISDGMLYVNDGNSWISTGVQYQSTGIADGSITAIKTDFITVSKNLFDKNNVLLKTSVDTDGTIISDSSRWLMDFFIPVTRGEVFSVPSGSFRIAYYREDFSFYVRTGTNDGRITVLNDVNIKYMKLSGTYNLDEMMINRGEVLLPYEPYGVKKIKPEYLPEIETEPIDLESITKDVKLQLDWEIDHPQPDIPRLTFTTVYTGFRYVKWLSRDGEIVYGNYGNELLQSKDEWKTRQRIGSELVPIGNGIGAVRELADGELIFSTNRDESIGLKSKVYKTVGYDRDNPSNATFKEVLEIGASQANVNNSWGISVYENIVTVSEYGLRGLEGARRVYLSQDFGDTFTLIFDLYTLDVEGKPTWTDSAHVHTATYDPYFNRIWVVVGDNPNTATYYSDDMGQSWTFVEGSNVVQYTGIMPLPDVVLFGSDRAPNGLHFYKRKSKSEMPIIEPLFELNAETGITHVFQLPYKRDWNPKTPTYFAGTGADGRGRSVIMGTVNGKRAYMLFEADLEGDLSGNVLYALGPTAQGNIIAEMSDSTVNGARIIIAKAPNWV